MTHPSDVSSSTPVLWPMQWSLPAGVHAVCTTRLGGFSKDPYGSFNLGDHVSDAPQTVAANRALLHRQLGGARPVFLSQVHGVEVITLEADTPDGAPADACLTHTSQVACTIMVADCLPLLLTDEAGSVVAAAHAGWRGLAAGVVEQTVHAVCHQAGVQPAQVRVWLGPCIGPSAFEVGPEVRDAFITAGAPAYQRAADCFQPHPSRASKWLADLAGLARLRLDALGVTSVAGNDSSPTWCTVSDRLRLFSFRRDGVTGRFAVCIWRD